MMIIIVFIRLLHCYIRLLYYSPLTFVIAFTKHHDELRFLFNSESTEGRCCALICSYTGIRYQLQTTLCEKLINWSDGKDFGSLCRKAGWCKSFFCYSVLQVAPCYLLKSRDCYILISPDVALSILRVPELFKQLQEVNRFDSFCLKLFLISQVFVSNKHFH